MDDELKSLIKLIVGVALAIFLLIVIINKTHNYNIKQHGPDVLVTEWVSPDGVHYWYQKTGYQAMLAPRYDSNGELIIDK